VLTPNHSFRSTFKAQTKSYITGPVSPEVKLDTFTISSPEEENNQSGEGILDIGRAALKLGRKILPGVAGAVEDIIPAFKTARAVGSALGDLATGEIGTAVSNILSEKFNKNPNWRPGFPGEAHLVLPTKEGLTRANFCGPGTNLKARQTRGDKGVSQIDDACQIHDMLYSIAKSEGDIRKADERLIKDIDKATDAGPTQKAVLKAGIRAKTLGEDIGLFGPETFTKIPGLKGSGRDLTNIISRSNLMRLARRLRERKLGIRSDPTISGSINVNPAVGASVGAGHGYFPGMRYPAKHRRPFSLVPRRSMDPMDLSGMGIGSAIGISHPSKQLPPICPRKPTDPMAFTDATLRKALDPTIRNATTGAADDFQTGRGPFKTADPIGGGFKEVIQTPARLLREAITKKLKKEKKKKRPTAKLVKKVRKQLGLGINGSDPLAGGQLGALAGLAASIIVPEIIKKIRGRGIQAGSGLGKEILMDAAERLMKDIGLPVSTAQVKKLLALHKKGKGIGGPALPGADVAGGRLVLPSAEDMAKLSAKMIMKQLGLKI
jgi:hypothetical protein